MAELCLPSHNPAMTSEQHTSKLRRFLQLEGEDKRLLLSAMGWLLIARIQLVVTPFDQLAHSLSSEDSGGSEVAVRNGANFGAWLRIAGGLIKQPTPNLKCQNVTHDEIIRLASSSALLSKPPRE